MIKQCAQLTKLLNC